MARREEAAAHAALSVTQNTETVKENVESVTPKKQSIEEKWNIPAWMLTKPVAPHMQQSPSELSK